LPNDKIRSAPRGILLSMEVIYIDELFLMNLAADYVIVLASARVCGTALHRWRYALSALVGALYASAAVLPGCAFLTGAVPKAACGAAMAAVAFAGAQKPMRCAVTFFAVAAAFGGAVWASSMLSGAPIVGGMYIPMSFKVLALSFAVCYAAVSLVFRRAVKSAGREILTVGAVFQGRSAVFRALRDTGNGLYDPVTGREVLVVSPAAAEALLPEGCSLMLRDADPVRAVEALGAVPELRGRFRLIPYSAVGVEGGLLPAFTPDLLTVDGRGQKDVMIAVSPALAGTDEYEAVF
jgi:stage II sporulation protein GA (sporulation sigma-E factor processing peptidase)